MNLGCSSEVRVYLPYMKTGKEFECFFICCRWVHIEGFLEMDHLFHEQIPSDFVRLRDQMAPDALITRYVVLNEETSIDTYEV